MKESNNERISENIFAIITCVLIVFLIVAGTNSCSIADWNEGICQECNVRYELRGVSNLLKYYTCPKCGKEVKRY